jgi:hypothetical protein
MSYRKTLSRLVLASMVTALIAAPVATAMPTDPSGTGAQDPRQQDMHASTVGPVNAPGATAAESATDARGEAAADGGTTTGTDARGEAAAGGGTSGASGSTELPGPPTWPAYPTPIPQPDAAPVADGGDGGGIDAPVALIAIAGTLALAGGMAVVAFRRRARTGVAH